LTSQGRGSFHKDGEVHKQDVAYDSSKASDVRQLNCNWERRRIGSVGQNCRAGSNWTAVAGRLSGGGGEEEEEDGEEREDEDDGFGHVEATGVDKTRR
jgi:hypothetical protein